jgi:hypothetical protein
VVVVSARYDAPEIATRLKAKGCFTKPVDLDVLTAFVKRWCK